MGMICTNQSPPFYENGNIADYVVSFGVDGKSFMMPNNELFGWNFLSTPNSYERCFYFSNLLQDANQLDVDINKHKSSLSKRGSLALRRKPSRKNRRSLISEGEEVLFKDSTSKLLRIITPLC